MLQAAQQAPGVTTTEGLVEMLGTVRTSSMLHCDSQSKRSHCIHCRCRLD